MSLTVDKNCTNIINDDYEDMVEQFRSIEVSNDEFLEVKVQKDLKLLFESALEARKGDRKYLNKILNIIHELIDETKVDSTIRDKISKTVKNAKTEWIEKCKKVGGSLFEEKESTIENVKNTSLKSDYIDENAIKLHEEIESLRGKVKSSDDALTSNNSPDISILNDLVKKFKEAFNTISDTALQLKKPVERRIEVLKEKIENGQFKKLSEDSLYTLERIHFIVNASTLKEKQTQQIKVNSNRETKLTNLESTWKQAKDRMNDLTDRLNWYLYCVKCVEENKSRPYGLSYSTGYFDRELKSPFANK